ncbi:dephospho-CoA kinase [Colwelliaceae bacterium 6441]
MSNYIVGLTGGIGSGKTTVSNIFAELGVEIIDADIIAREVVNPNSDALIKIIQHFGNEIINANGELNRSALRSKIFSNDEEKQWLNALLHPIIRQEILTQLARASGDYCILSAPLLFENNLQALVNRTLVIDVSLNTQIERTCQRDDKAPDEVQAIINSQISRDKRMILADDIINNDNIHLSHLKEEVFKLNLNYKSHANSANCR